MKIILIGFMGSGKTSVATEIAKIKKLTMVDTDDLIVEKAEMSTTEIFDQFGETRYREYEIQVARDIRGLQNHVVATGGGVILNKIILDYLREGGGVVVFLRTSFDEIVRRVIAHDRPRPLFTDKEAARQLYNFRLTLYESYADHIVDTDNKNIKEVASEIVDKT